MPDQSFDDAHGRPRILIADDDADMRAILSDYLTYQGYETIVAANGEEALALATARPPDVALVDVRMPGPSGMVLAAQLQERQLDLAVIIITAYGSVEGATEAMRTGAFHYLTKPLRMGKVLAAVEEALTAGRRQAQVRVEELVVDLRSGHVTLEGEPLTLSPLEERLLICLARRRGQLVRYEALWREGWGYEAFPDKHVIWMAMSRLRRKVGAAHISCVKGRGYRLRTLVWSQKEGKAGNC